MTLPNTDVLKSTYVTNSTLANTIDDKIMGVLTLLADMHGIDISSARTLNEAMAVFDNATGLITYLIAQGAASAHGLIVEDTGGDKWRITSDTIVTDDDTDAALWIDRWDTNVWTPVLAVCEDGVWHDELQVWFGTSTITEVAAGTGLTGGGTTGTVTLAIDTGGVDTAQLADAAVTADKIAAGAIVDAAVDANAGIDGSKLANVSVAAPKISSAAITQNRVLIADGAGGVSWEQIGTDSIGDGVLTTAKYDAVSVNQDAITTDLGEGVGAAEGYVLQSLGTDPDVAPTWGQVITAGIKDLNVTTGKIAANAITAAKIERNSNSGYVLTSNGALADPSWQSTGTASVADNSITMAKLDHSGSTDGLVIASNGVGSDPAWEQVSALGIATNAVTETKILDGNVTGPKLANNAVTYDKVSTTNNTAIRNSNISGNGSTLYYPLISAGTSATATWGQIKAAALESGAVTMAKIYTTGSSDGQVLTSTGSGTAPAWETIHVVRSVRAASYSVNNNVNANVSFTSILHDSYGGLDLGAGDSTIRVPIAGYYLISGRVLWPLTNESGAERWFMQIVANGYPGGTTWGYFADWAGLDVSPSVEVTTVCNLTTTTDVSLQVYQNTGGAIDVEAFLHIVKVG